MHRNLSNSKKKKLKTQFKKNNSKSEYLLINSYDT
jgi:hypothetical protein